MMWFFYVDVKMQMILKQNAENSQTGKIMSTRAFDYYNF